MEKFSLGPLHVVGNELLDAQHQMILNYMAKLYRSLLDGKSKEQIFQLTERLDTYCKLHFLDEELVLEEIMFPEIEGHKAQHSMFLRHLEEFTGRFDERNVTATVNELLFLKNWFMEHIAEFDKTYSKFSSNRSKS